MNDFHGCDNLGLEPTTPRQVTYQNGWPVPAGWKLVPCEPASRQVCYIAMEIQGVDEKGYCRFDDPRWSESVKTAERAYKAALEGAHEPPAAPQAEPSDDEWLRRLGELLGEYAEAVSFDSEDDIERAANAIHSHARALLARYGQPAASVEPVAQIYRKGFQHGSIVWTAAGLAADLPDGTELYAAIDAAQAQPKRRPYNASGSLSEYGIFPECDAAPAAQAPRACTCHPDDRPDGPCRERYAASECQALAVLADREGRQQDARDGRYMRYVASLPEGTCERCSLRVISSCCPDNPAACPVPDAYAHRRAQRAKEDV